MWIGAIKYLGFDVACVYKNGKLIWRPAELKLVDCNNACIVTTPMFQLDNSDICSLFNLKFNINSSSKSNLSNLNALHLTPQSTTVLQEKAALQVLNSWVRLFSHQHQLVSKNNIKIQNSILIQPKKQIFSYSQNKLLLFFTKNLQSFAKPQFINKIKTLLQPSNVINSKYGVQFQLFYKLLIQSSERIYFFPDITIKGKEKISVRRSRLGIGEKNSKIYQSSQLLHLVAKQFAFQSNYVINNFVELQDLMAVSQEYDIQHQFAAVTRIRLNDSNSGNIAEDILVKDIVKLYFSQGIDSQAKQNLQLNFFAEAMSGQGISSKTIYGISLLDNSLMQLSAIKNEKARREVEIIGKLILRNDKISQISERSLIYLKNGSVLFCDTSYMFNITNKNQIINYAFLNNNEALSIILDEKLSCHVCTNLSTGAPDNVRGVAKQSLVICNSLNSIQPTYLLANSLTRIQTNFLLQLDAGVYYFADKKNPIKKIVQFNNYLNLNFLDYFLVVVEKNNLRYKNYLNVTEKKLLNNSMQQQLFSFAQTTLAQNKENKYISNLLTKIKTSMAWAYKKDDLQLNNNNVLWNYLKLTLSYFSEIFDYSSYFSSSSSMHGFATLTTDSWIYPKPQETNLFIQQVYSYSHDTGEIT